MIKFNLSTRIELFAICVSLEVDVKDFIINNSNDIFFSENMLKKAKERKNDLLITNKIDVLNQLDLKDYIEIICQSPYQFGLNNEKARLINEYFAKVIPVRNRVMHTKPLEIGDRSLLIEIMDTINASCAWIDWKEVQETKRKILNDPSQFLSRKYIPKIEYNPNIYHNLPEPEFDDTGFIGRNKDRSEIKELILNNKNQIITIVGNGGVGKTAIVVKTLYDLIDDPKCTFECIIWITLKTQTLSNGEFVQIKEHIDNIPELYRFSQKIIITDSKIPSKEMLIKFMEDYKVLLVLDNLETINSNEINAFMKEIPEKSKVLITSRHGLGELEIRKKLDGLDKQDTVVYFRELSKYYGLDLYKRSDSEIQEITVKKLYSNPLSIKWFISGVFNGMNENSILTQKEDLINFCISNVYEKLKEDARRILQIFLLEKKKLSYGLLDYYMDIDEVNLRESINQLLSTYMINALSGEFVMNDMSREYISINFPPTNEFVLYIIGRRKQLKQNMQSVKVNSEQAPFNPQSICAKLDDDDKQLATFYLQQALLLSKEKKWEESNKFCLKAKNIEPDFFEVYKIMAFIDAERGEYFGALSNYETAILKCKNDKERAIVYYLFSIFYTIKMQELDLALDCIEKSDSILPNTSEIILEKARVYMYMGKFIEAETLLNRVTSMEKNPVLRTQNILASRYAELYRRKASIFEPRDSERRYEHLKLAIEHLSSVKSLDIKSGIILISVLYDLSFLYYIRDAMELLLKTINENYMLLSKLNQNKKQKMCENLRGHKEEIDSDIYLKMERFIKDLKFVSGEITNNNEGIVTSLKEYFGFISNHVYKNTNSIYFLKKHAYDEIQVGDQVSFEIYDGKNGKAARNIVRTLIENNQDLKIE